MTTEEIKNQAHKDFRDTFFTTPEGHTAIIASWSKGEQEVFKRFEDFIDSLVDKTVQMSEERIAVVIKQILLDINFLEGITGEENRDIVYKNYKKMKEYFYLITNKSDINNPTE